MIIKKLLLDIVSKHNLESLCLEIFEKNLENYIKEDPQEYKSTLGKGKVSTMPHSISYKIMDDNNSDFIEIKLWILMNDNPVGDYRLILSFPDVQIVDDYFVIY